MVVCTKSKSASDCRVTDRGWLCGRRSNVSFLHADVTRSFWTSETRCHACSESELWFFVAVVTFLLTQQVVMVLTEQTLNWIFFIRLSIKQLLLYLNKQVMLIGPILMDVAFQLNLLCCVELFKICFSSCTYILLSTFPSQRLFFLSESFSRLGPCAVDCSTCLAVLSSFPLSMCPNQFYVAIFHWFSTTFW